MNRAGIVAAQAPPSLVAGASWRRALRWRALAPVGGDDITTLRIAVYDVLDEAGVVVMTSPTCEADADGTRCVGTTLAGGSIVAVADAAEGDSTLSVDGHQIEVRPIADIIDRAAGAAP